MPETRARALANIANTGGGVAVGGAGARFVGNNGGSGGGAGGTTNGTNGTANTGGGGGGAWQNGTAGAGGSGIVIVQYAI